MCYELKHTLALERSRILNPLISSAPPWLTFSVFATMETPCETNLPFEQIKGVAILNSPKFLNSKYCSNAVILAL